MTALFKSRICPYLLLVAVVLLVLSLWWRRESVDQAYISASMLHSLDQVHLRLHTLELLERGELDKIRNMHDRGLKRELHWALRQHSSGATLTEVSRPNMLEVLREVGKYGHAHGRGDLVDLAEQLYVRISQEDAS